MAATPSVVLDAVSGKRGYLQQATISDCISHHVLAAATAENVPVPAGSRWVQVVSELTVYVRRDATASIAGADTEQTDIVPVLAFSGRLIPCENVTNISVISGSAGIVSLEFLL